jgi:hypothetical protein
MDARVSEYAIFSKTIASPSRAQAKSPASEEAGYNNLPGIAQVL